MSPSSERPSFPAKLLLFGEYTIINGGSALAIPFHKYSGQWKQASETKLLPFFEHIITLQGCDIDLIGQAVEENWVYDSNIPLGYGLGSSGSLSAAAYKAFFPERATELVDLKEILSQIESHFHGKSSGLDPLTCYTGKAVHISQGQIRTIEAPALPEQLSLYDSGIPRNGKPLIKYFTDRLELDDDFDSVVFALAQLNERIIRQYLKGEDLRQTFFEISKIQYESFQHMIPLQMMDEWKQGLDSGRYAMKLSGAGGGGYFLKWAISED